MDSDTHMHTVLTLKTTGQGPAHGSRISEFVGIEIINHRRTGSRLHYTFKPKPSSAPSASEPHAPHPFAQRFDERADEIVTFVAGTTLVVHNAPVVLTALNAELKRLERPSIESHANGVIDTPQPPRHTPRGRAAVPFV